MKDIHNLLKYHNITIIFFQTQLLLKLSKTQLVLLADKNHGNKDGFWKAAQKEHMIYTQPPRKKKRMRYNDLLTSTAPKTNSTTYIASASSPHSVARLGTFYEQADALAAECLMALHYSSTPTR